VTDGFGSALDEAISFGGLLAAYRRARRRKPKTADMDRFDLRLEHELLVLRDELAADTWTPGPYREFPVNNVKPRVVSAAPFRDRVVHQALMAACAAEMEAALGPEVYANRKGMGTHAAIRRYQEMAREGRFVLTLDVSRYFASIDHALLRDLVRAVVPDNRTVGLIERVLASSPAVNAPLRHFDGDDLLAPLGRRTGLPLGNLTSQTLANLYLTPLDRALRGLPGLIGHVRYVDDLAVVGTTRHALRHAIGIAEDVLANLHLRLKSERTGIHGIDHGVRFLGYVVAGPRVRLPGASRRRFEARFSDARVAWARGTLTVPEIGARVAAWAGHAAFGMRSAALDAYLWRETVLA